MCKKIEKSKPKKFNQKILFNFFLKNKLELDKILASEMSFFPWTATLLNPSFSQVSPSLCLRQHILLPSLTVANFLIPRQVLSLSNTLKKN